MENLEVCEKLANCSKKDFEVFCLCSVNEAMLLQKLKKLSGCRAEVWQEKDGSFTVYKVLRTKEA